MKRYNIFYQVHKGLKLLLYETAVLLQQTDFDNPEDATEALEQLSQLMDLFDQHAHIEDNFILLAVSKKDATVADMFAQEHVRDYALSNRIRGLFTAFSPTIPAMDKMALGQSINAAFVEYMLFNLQHMAREEKLLNEILWSHYTDEQLQLITMEMVKQIPAVKMDQFNRWMMRGLSNSEIIDWLKLVKDKAPNIVFNRLLSLVESELTERRSGFIRDAITEGALLA